MAGFWRASEHGVNWIKDCIATATLVPPLAAKGVDGAGSWSQALVITTGAAEGLALVEIGEAISGSVSILARVSVRAMRPAGLITFVSLPVHAAIHKERR